VSDDPTQQFHQAQLTKK